jgi:transposase
MDVHQETIRLAVLSDTEATFLEERTVPTEVTALRRALRPWGERYRLQCFYEASSCGYVVQRWLAQAEIACTVVAASKTPRAAGNRVKTDRRDARTLAIQGRANQLAPVHVPTLEDEALRGLAHQYAAQRQAVRAARQRVQAWLLLRGQQYQAGTVWTSCYWQWLKALRFGGLDAEVFAEYLAEVTDGVSRLTVSERLLQTLAQTPPYLAAVGRLGCFRGITPLRGLVLLAETLDFTRFPGAAELMGYYGLVSREDSSGGRRRQGSITKTGSGLARYELVEAAWSYQHPPRIGQALAARQAGQPAEVIAISWAAQRRLHRKYWKLVHARKPTGVAAVAVARELTGFLWAAMTQAPTS